MARQARDRGYPVQLVAGNSLGTEEFRPDCRPRGRRNALHRPRRPAPTRRSGARRRAVPSVRFRAGGLHPLRLWCRSGVGAGGRESRLAGAPGDDRSPCGNTSSTPCWARSTSTRRATSRFRTRCGTSGSGRHVRAAGAERGQGIRRSGARAGKETIELGRSADRSKVRRAAGSLLGRLGVRGRLLLAFFGISAFAVIAAAAAMYSFAEVGKVLERITRERVPPALASLELSRQAERIVTAAPAFLAATTRERHQEVSQAIAAEVERLRALLDDLKGSAIAPGALAAVEPAIDGLERNLAALDALVAARLELAERKEQLLRKLSGTNIATQRLVAPGVLVMDSKLAEWRRAIAAAGLDEDASAAPRRASSPTRSRPFMPQQKAQIELSAINDTLIKAADAPRRRRPAAARLPAAALARHARGARQRVRRQAAAAPARAGRGVPGLHGRDRRASSRCARRSSGSSARRRACSPRTSRLSRQVGDAPRPAGRRGEPRHRRGQPGGARGAALRLGRADRHGPAQPAELRA